MTLAERLREREERIDAAKNAFYAEVRRINDEFCVTPAHATHSDHGPVLIVGFEDENLHVSSSPYPMILPFRKNGNPYARAVWCYPTCLSDAATKD
jgi:hypothetical protein